ncbi:MAG: hypothetical protein AAB360_03010 [Patescibacteria group bacterium]
MSKNRDGKGPFKRSERQTAEAGKRPFHRLGKFFYQILNFRFRRRDGWPPQP